MVLDKVELSVEADASLALLSNMTAPIARKLVAKEKIFLVICVLDITFCPFGWLDLEIWDD